ncbi:MAG: elongation factor 1-beta family protein, partial [Saprospiraceae bacterium]|nr:elongation factor 1-beta family protein [Saprospiraceae bacterium]
VIYEVKPQEAGQDMAALEAKIRSIEMDGLMWGGEFKVVDVAFGIQKLIVQGIVEDEKVPLDDLEERMQSFKEEVSSIDQIAMNKVG